MCGPDKLRPITRPSQAIKPTAFRKCSVRTQLPLHLGTPRTAHKFAKKLKSIAGAPRLPVKIRVEFPKRFWAP